MFDSTNVNVSYCNKYSQVVNILPACIGTIKNCIEHLSEDLNEN